ncbi:cyclic nucleotide-binding protein [Gottschalkia acidurici 9a]|uniref:Cyclic nucleotide-binding protein n=1 Tax=Gottschalkia acidurici (strain ATCC 7906 / DSM 604 / BCRC 14475 / CIP 104303 / KCTC 5404 / NCIMB 10678 / 9a) TaxID=1128398 RepID=K0AYI0_GOTA9|nr:Crp/Fnr family transcriptional regulator [Gottschalkia acidurici]AFS77441.1 cyclic nucleotide-binding protein [Gottschalkia acidurici 9a]
MFKYAHKLKPVLLFKDMESDEIAKVLNCLSYYQREYDKNEFIILQGDELKEIGIIIEGEVIVTKDRPDGDYAIVDVLKKYDTFGEDIIYSGLKSSLYTLRAKKHTTIIYIDGKKISSDESTSCKYRSKVNLNMLRRLAEYSIFINTKMKYMGIKSLKKRVATFLLDEFERYKSNTFSIDMNREEMADFLNGTRPAVSKNINAV